MKKGDFIWGLLLAAIVVFLAVPETNKLFTAATETHPYGMGFIKFAVLATMGEFLAIRITKGKWEKPVGYAYKIIARGVIGMVIVYMFKMFPAGVHATIKMKEGWVSAVVLAFLSSAIMNLTFGPMFMAAHRVLDGVIENRVLKHRVKVIDVVNATDWADFIRFVIGKTIPFFWIPMHTIAFLLPNSYRVLSAAFLSIALGAILAYAKRKDIK